MLLQVYYQVYNSTIKCTVYNTASLPHNNIQTYNGAGENFAMEEIVSLLLDGIEVLLQPCVGVRVAVGKVVDVSLDVKTKRKRHDIVLAMLRTSVVIDVLVRNSCPEPATGSMVLKVQKRTLILTKNSKISAQEIRKSTFIR